MFQKIGQAAARAASSVSRRGFLGRLGQVALGTAGLLGGLLTSTADAQVVYCTTNTDCGSYQYYCARAIGKCTGAGRCARRCLWSKPVLAPVCGCNGITYANACQASSYGVNVAYAGRCKK
jgi:hypothetical protein